MPYGSLKPKGYLPRLLDSVVEKRLAEFGAVEICGTRWSGKSWTALAFAESVTKVDEGVSLYEEDSVLALLGNLPHVVDEWQDVPVVWNYVRHAVDDRGNIPGQYLLTGSSTPLVEEGRHSGAGRISRARMRTMTLFEQGISTGAVSLRSSLRANFLPPSMKLPSRIMRGFYATAAGPPFLAQLLIGRRRPSMNTSTFFSRSVCEKWGMTRFFRGISLWRWREIWERVPH